MTTQTVTEIIRGKHARGLVYKHTHTSPICQESQEAADSQEKEHRDHNRASKYHSPLKGPEPLGKWVTFGGQRSPRWAWNIYLVVCWEYHEKVCVPHKIEHVTCTQCPLKMLRMIKANIEHNTTWWGWAVNSMLHQHMSRYSSIKYIHKGEKKRQLFPQNNSNSNVKTLSQQVSFKPHPPFEDACCTSYDSLQRTKPAKRTTDVTLSRCPMNATVQQVGTAPWSIFQIARRQFSDSSNCRPAYEMPDQFSKSAEVTQRLAEARGH